MWRIRRLHLTQQRAKVDCQALISHRMLSGQKLLKTLLIKQIKVVAQAEAEMGPQKAIPLVSLNFTITDILCSWKASYSLEDNVESLRKLLTLWSLLPSDIL